jgi:hypothetical protein
MKLGALALDYDGTIAVDGVFDDLQGYCVWMIDPEGDYRSLEALPGVVTLGGDDPPPQARELARALRHPDVSVIIDLSKLSQHQKRDYLRTLLPLINRLRRTTGLPHKIVIDEAHYFLSDPDSGGQIDSELAGYILVTYRISSLAPAIRNAGDTVALVTRETDRDEAKTLLEMCRSHPSSGLSRDLHLRRHDFSRWIEGVFRDRPLAAHLRKVEGRVAYDGVRDIADALGQVTRARYDIADPVSVASTS